MSRYLMLILSIISSVAIFAQIDPVLLRRVPKDTTGLQMNMDAVYNRPFLELGKLPVALGGYVEANYQYLQENGISEGHQFQMRRLTLFVSSSECLKSSSPLVHKEGRTEIIRRALAGGV